MWYIQYVSLIHVIIGWHKHWVVSLKTKLLSRLYVDYTFKGMDSNYYRNKIL
jgi:hypothetical protein